MKLNVIVPLRDRDDILELFLYQMTKIFEAQGVEPTYFLAYQNNNNPFNKGILNNTCFQFAKKLNLSERFLFNDVSVFPRNDTVIDYKQEIKDGELYHFMGNDFCINRFFMINKNTYEFINGYSNLYNGWGYEDTDLQYRCDVAGVKIKRDNFKERFVQYSYIDIIFEDVVEKYKKSKGTDTHKVFTKLHESGKTTKEIAAHFIDDGLSDLNKYNAGGKFEKIAPNVYKLDISFEKFKKE